MYILCLSGTFCVTMIIKKENNQFSCLIWLVILIKTLTLDIFYYKIDWLKPFIALRWYWRLGYKKVLNENKILGV